MERFLTNKYRKIIYEENTKERLECWREHQDKKNQYQLGYGHCKCDRGKKEINWVLLWEDCK
jgi:hypothetical protein